MKVIEYRPPPVCSNCRMKFSLFSKISLFVKISYLDSSSSDYHSKNDFKRPFRTLRVLQGAALVPKPNITEHPRSMETSEVISQSERSMKSGNGCRQLQFQSGEIVYQIGMIGEKYQVKFKICLQITHQIN